MIKGNCPFSLINYQIKISLTLGVSLVKIVTSGDPVKKFLLKVDTFVSTFKITFSQKQKGKMQKRFLKGCYKEVSEKLKRKQQQILERVPQIIDEYLEEEAECNS